MKLVEFEGNSLIAVKPEDEYGCYSLIIKSGRKKSGEPEYDFFVNLDDEAAKDLVKGAKKLLKKVREWEDSRDAD